MDNTAVVMPVGAEIMEALGRMVVRLSAVEHALRFRMDEVFGMDKRSPSPAVMTEASIRAAIRVTEFAAATDPRLRELADVFREALRLEQLRTLIVHGRYERTDFAAARSSMLIASDESSERAAYELTVERLSAEESSIDAFLSRLELTRPLKLPARNRGYPMPDA